MTALAMDNNHNWQALQRAMKGEAQSTVTNVFEVADGEADTRTIKLLADITAGADDTYLEINATSSSGKVIILDLNGKKLDRGLTSATSNGHVIKINQNAELTVKDSVGTGKITGGNNSGIGGGINNYKGTFTMTGGSITGNTATDSGGGGVYNNGKFIMNGGNIAGNLALNGGGVFNDNEGTFTLNGGSITGNKADYGGGIQNEDALYLTAAKGKNVTISGNTAGKAEGGVANWNEMHVSGKIIIKDNVCNSADYPINLATNAPITVDGTLTGSEIWVTFADSESDEHGIGVLTTDYTKKSGSEKLNDFFRYDGPYYAKINDNNEIEIVEDKPTFGVSGLIEEIFKLIRFKKTTDDIKTFSILTVIFRFIENIFSVFSKNK